MRWVSELAGTRAEERDLRLLGPDADRLRAAVGPAAVMWAAEVGEDVIAKAGQELALLGGSASLVDAMRGATTSTTLRVLTILSGLAEPGASVVTSEAAEATRDLARRGLTLHEFTRVMHFGHSVLAAAFFDAVSADATGDHDLTELRRVSQQLFKLMDELVADMSAVFLDEQSAWGASKSAAQLELVKKIIEGTPTDPREAERLLDYPLNGAHLAVVAWGLSAGKAPRTVSAPPSIRSCGAGERP